MIKDNLRDLLGQLEALPLENGSTAKIMPRLKAALERK